MNRRPPRSPLFPYTPLFRSVKAFEGGGTAAERQKAGEHFDDGGFSAAVGTEEAEDLSLFDPEADVVDGREVAEAPDQMFGGDGGFGGIYRDVRHRLNFLL